jgi:hypothetical protein
MFGGSLACICHGAHPLNSWLQVEIIGQGPRVQVKVDGSLQIDYTDPDPIPSGSLALETMDGSAASIDDIKVYGPPPAPPDPRRHHGRAEAARHRASCGQVTPVPWRLHGPRSWAAAAPLRNAVPHSITGNCPTRTSNMSGIVMIPL